jgi:hypothetical protein
MPGGHATALCDDALCFVGSFFTSQGEKEPTKENPSERRPE